MQDNHEMRKVEVFGLAQLINCVHNLTLYLLTRLSIRQISNFRARVSEACCKLKAFAIDMIVRVQVL